MQETSLELASCCVLCAMTQTLVGGCSWVVC